MRFRVLGRVALVLVRAGKRAKARLLRKNKFQKFHKGVAVIKAVKRMESH